MTKVQSGMGSNLFSLQGWSNLAFWAQVAVWTCGFLGVVSGITLYWAKDNATYLKDQAAQAAAEADRIARGPRLLSIQTASNFGAAAKAAGLSVLVVQLQNPEARHYSAQFVRALAAAEVPFRTMSIGIMATYGVEVWGSGPEAERLLTVLNHVGIQARAGMPMLPLLGSVAGQYQGFVGLIVGLKPEL